MFRFEYDKRLGISVPDLDRDWQSYDKQTQELILSKWEEIRGSIPDRVKELENEINEKQSQLYNEENFLKSCELNTEIADLASAINDLWLWFRAQNELSMKNHL